MVTKRLTIASADSFEGEFPEMTPMLMSAWLLTVNILLHERNVRGRVNILSSRVGVFTHAGMWIHQCFPHSLYSRIRKFTRTPVSEAPRAVFSMNIKKIQVIGPNSQIEAMIVLNGEKELQQAISINRFYIWNWMRTMTNNYTCYNGISMKHDDCNKCGYKLTKQEKTLIMLHNLGRQLDAKRVN